MSEAEFHYDPSPDLDRSLSERLRTFPRQPDLLQYLLRSLVNLVIRAYLRIYHRLTIFGRENLPAEGSFVMISNHSSHLDALCLLAALPLGRLHRAFAAAAADYFFVSIPRTALAVLAVNALPFHRQLHVRQSISLCRQLLAKPGNVLILFPEGTRSHSSIPGDFKPGIGIMLANSNVPAVPCYLQGAAQAWPKGAWLPRPRRVTLIIGSPKTYMKIEQSKEGAEEICRDLRAAVIALALSREGDPGAPGEPYRS